MESLKKHEIITLLGIAVFGIYLIFESSIFLTENIKNLLIINDLDAIYISLIENIVYVLYFIITSNFAINWITKNSKKVLEKPLRYLVLVIVTFFIIQPLEFFQFSFINSYVNDTYADNFKNYIEGQKSNIYLHGISSITYYINLIYLAILFYQKTKNEITENEEF